MKKIIALSIVNVLLGYGIVEAYPVGRAVSARPAPAVRATPAPRPVVKPSTPLPAPKTQRATPNYEGRGFTPLTPNTVIVPHGTSTKKGDKKDEE